MSKGIPLYDDGKNFARAHPQDHDDQFTVYSGRKSSGNHCHILITYDGRIVEKRNLHRGQCKDCGGDAPGAQDCLKKLKELGEIK